MYQRKMIIPVALVMMTAVCFCAACESSSHKSVRVYEYKEDPSPRDQREPQETVESPEWEMTSPERMIVDPD